MSHLLPAADNPQSWAAETRAIALTTFTPGVCRLFGFSNAVDPTAKNYHWGDFTQGLIKAKQEDFDNTLLLDSSGHVTEGPGFNVFIIKDGQVATPQSGVLEGITRKVTITTGGGLVPIVCVNQHRYSNDAPGELTLALQATYWEWHNDNTMSEVISY